MRKDAYFFSSIFNKLCAYFCGVLQSVQAVKRFLHAAYCSLRDAAIT